LVDLTHPKVDTGFREWFHLLKPRTSAFFTVASSHDSITEISTFNQSQPSSLFSSAELFDWLKEKQSEELYIPGTINIDFKLYSFDPKRHIFKQKLTDFPLFLSINFIVQKMYRDFYFVFKTNAK
jgi:hypothetical protein